MKFENDIERDFAAYLIDQKHFNEKAVYRCIEEIRNIKSFERLTSGCLERTIKGLQYLLEYERANYEKYNCWARATKNYTKEEIEELHRWMRMD